MNNCKYRSSSNVIATQFKFPKFEPVLNTTNNDSHMGSKSFNINVLSSSNSNLSLPSLNQFLESKNTNINNNSGCINDDIFTNNRSNSKTSNNCINNSANTTTNAEKTSDVNNTSVTIASSTLPTIEDIDINNKNDINVLMDNMGDNSNNNSKQFDYNYFHSLSQIDATNNNDACSNNLSLSLNNNQTINIANKNKTNVDTKSINTNINKHGKRLSIDTETQLPLAKKQRKVNSISSNLLDFAQNSNVSDKTLTAKNGIGLNRRNQTNNNSNDITPMTESTENGSQMDDILNILNIIPPNLNGNYNCIDNIIEQNNCKEKEKDCSNVVEFICDCNNNNNDSISSLLVKFVIACCCFCAFYFFLFCIIIMRRNLMQLIVLSM